MENTLFFAEGFPAIEIHVQPTLNSVIIDQLTRLGVDNAKQLLDHNRATTAFEVQSYECNRDSDRDRDLPLLLTY